MTTSELLTKVLRFCERNNMALSRFGRNAVQASNLVDRLKRGDNITLATANRVLAYMREYRK